MNPIVLDLETTITNQNPCAWMPENDIVVGVIYTPDTHSYYELETPEDFQKFEWGRYDTLIAHNAKFEYQYLFRMGLYDKIPMNVWDTQVAEYCLSGNRDWTLNLDHLGKKYLNLRKDEYIDMLMKHGVCPSTYPRGWLYNRCEQDVYTTYNVMLKQRQWIMDHNPKLLGVVQTHSNYTPVLAEMEMRGMMLRDKEVLVATETCANHLHNIERGLKRIADINWNSNHQKAAVLYKSLGFDIPVDYRGKPLVGKPTADWPDGLPKVDTPTLDKLKPKTKEQRDVLKLLSDWSEQSKLYNTYFSYYAEIIEGDKVIHCNLNNTRAHTHRLTSSKPNLQQQPRQLKYLFGTRLDKVMEIDYAKLEYVVAGQLADDPVALQDIQNGVDAHSLTAEMLFGSRFKKLKEGTPKFKQLRTEAKSHTFKPLYGGTSGTKAEQKYYTWFMEKHEQIARWHTRLIGEVMDQGYTESPSGMRFYFNSIPHTNGRLADETKIKNYPVQYFATAEIVPIGIINLWRAMRDMKLKSYIVMTVHDSIVLEVVDSEVEIIKELAQTSMVDDVKRYINDVYDYNFYFPLEIEINVGEHW